MSGFSGFEVRDSLDMGRYVIAKRCYYMGDLILDEVPLLISPVDAFGTKDENSVLPFNQSKFDCVGCFKTLPIDEMYFCHKCEWPVCSQKCSKNSLHRKYECSLFSSMKIDKSSKAFEHMYILRAVLMFKDKNRQKWEQFAALSSSFGPKQEQFLANNKEGIEEYTKILNSYFRLDVDSTVVEQIVTTFSINSFRMEGEDYNGNSYRAKAVYNYGSLFAHSCSPSADWVILPTNYNGVKRWHLRIYARRDILCDEPINVSYIMDCLSRGTAARKKYIEKTFYFDCKCLRCDDPTDLLFYTEAVKCPFCSDKNLTADIPSDEFSTWTCNHCKRCNKYSYAKKCVEGYKSALQSIMMSPSHNALNSLLLLSSNTKYGLSENHRERIFTMFFWIQCLGEDQFIELIPHSAESDEIFVEFMKRVTKCIQVFRMFGQLNDIVELEACSARAIAAYYFKSTDFCSIPYDSYLPEERFQILTSICAHMKSAYDTNEVFPSEYSGCLSMEFILTTGFNFWKDQLGTMRNEDVENRISSYGFLGNGTVKVFDQTKTYLGKLWTWVCALSGSLNNDSNELVKPDITLLMQHDFNCTN